MNKKVFKIISIVIIWGLFINNLSALIICIAGIVKWRGSYGLPLFSLFFMVVKLFCLFICGIVVIGKPRKKILSVFAAIYIILSVITLAEMTSINGYSYTRSILLLLLFCFAFIIALISKGEFKIKDTESEYAKNQLQNEKQISIYKNQLEEGIISETEYKQLLAKNKDGRETTGQ